MLKEKVDNERKMLTCLRHPMLQCFLDSVAPNTQLGAEYCIDLEKLSRTQNLGSTLAITPCIISVRLAAQAAQEHAPVFPEYRALLGFLYWSSLPEILSRDS